MQRYDSIVNNDKFKKLLRQIDESEADRRFCRHGIGHLLDVCRIAYILNLEKGCGYDKDLIYAAGLLHDIGRVRQYQYGEDHHTAGIPYVKEILAESGYSADETEIITGAISAHKSADNGSIAWGKESYKIFAGLLYEADKKSRNCFMCEAYDDCNWTEDKKNKGVI